MAGKGSEVGSNFREISELIAGVELRSKIGVCLDTCHVNDGGYNPSFNKKLIKSSISSLSSLTLIKLIT